MKALKHEDFFEHELKIIKNELDRLNNENIDNEDEPKDYYNNCPFDIGLKKLDKHFHLLDLKFIMLRENFYKTISEILCTCRKYYF